MNVLTLIGVLGKEENYQNADWATDVLRESLPDIAAGLAKNLVTGEHLRPTLTTARRITDLRVFRKLERNEPYVEFFYTLAEGCVADTAATVCAVALPLYLESRFPEEYA